MGQVFLMLKQVLHKTIVLIGLVSLIYTTGFFLVEQSSYADTTKQAIKQPFILDEPQTATDREAAYKEAIEEVKKPDGLEKEYEKDLKIFKKENPGENPVVEGAKGLIDKVTGKD
ncbi:hypothetical protein FM036_34555 [Nostoc sp. HG1]|nr:hypothetical protein [Nostoc sp. HG1]